MKQVISVHLPYWPTDRMLQSLGKTAPSPDEPFALVTLEKQKQRIVAVNQAGHKQGIALGMSATQARALFGNIQIASAKPEADAEALYALGQWALKRYSPFIALDVPDGLFMDATGVAHLFGGEEAMVADITEKLTSFGLTARVAMAPTYGAAWALTHVGKDVSCIVSPDRLHDALRFLPISGLRLDAVIMDDLQTLGFDTIGELSNAPRVSLLLRFGKDIIMRIDQAYGVIPECLKPIAPPEPVTLRRAFAEPISNPETIKRYIGLMAEEICRQLELRALGGRCFDLLFLRVDNSQQALRVGLAQGMRDAKRLARLFADKLGTVDPGFGIEFITLTVSWTESFKHQQDSLTESSQSSNIISLVDVLANRIGKNNIYQFCPVESDVPERSVARQLPGNANPQIAWPVKWPRPVCLLRHPQPIETIAMLPDHPPASFTWKGERHKVRHADGPERICGEWWKRDAEFEAVRDYFQIEDEQGRRFWIFRSGDGVLSDSGSFQWFMHGLFA